MGTSVCPGCGETIFGTRFCELCGASASVEYKAGLATEPRQDLTEQQQRIQSAYAKVRQNEQNTNQYPTPRYGAASGVAQNYGQRTNTLAIISLIFGLLGGGLVAVITGHIAKKQIEVTREAGDGFATAGLALGYISLIILVIYIIVVISAVSNAVSYSNYGY